MNSLSCLKRSILERKGFPLVGKQYDLINNFFKGKIKWENLPIYAQGCLIKMGEQNPEIYKLITKNGNIDTLNQNLYKKVEEFGIIKRDFDNKILYLIGEDQSKHIRNQELFISNNNNKTLEKVANTLLELNPETLFALTDDGTDSFDSFSLKLLIFIREFSKKKGIIKVIYNTDGTIRMHLLNNYGTKPERINTINKYIDKISDILNIDIPKCIYIEESIGLIKPGYYVPCIYAEKL